MKGTLCSVRSFQFGMPPKSRCISVEIWFSPSIMYHVTHVRNTKHPYQTGAIRDQSRRSYKTFKSEAVLDPTCAWLASGLTNAIFDPLRTFWFDVSREQALRGPYIHRSRLSLLSGWLSGLQHQATEQHKSKEQFCGYVVVREFSPSFLFHPIFPVYDYILLLLHL